MKAKNYFLTSLLLFSTGLLAMAQSGMTIHSDGKVTVNGNLTITLPAFTCGTTLTDTCDGKTYNTVLIGTQCWFAQNLNVGTKILGTANQTNNGVLEKYCYNDDENNCNIYGGLYQWDEAMQYVTTEGAQGICPTGWHLPTESEWTTLTDYLDGLSVAGGKMKETGSTHWATPNTGATNNSGFTALPGGNREGNVNLNGNFNYLTVIGYFWSSSQSGDTNALNWALVYSNEYVYRSGSFKTYGFSARCLKN